MVKYNITKEEYAALSPELQAEYRESGDGYKLDVSGIDLKAADKLEGERSKRRQAEKEKKDAEDALEAFREGDDRPAMQAKHEKDIKKEKDRAEAAEKKYTDKVRKDTLGDTANTLATALSGTNAKVILPHITSRLDVDMTDPENPKLVVLGADGKPTDKKIDDLKAEFLANKDFAGIVIASRASGGGASKSGESGRSGLPSGGAAPFTNTGNKAPLDSLSNRDLIAEVEARRAARGQPIATNR